jgi:hypothetical protein
MGRTIHAPEAEREDERWLGDAGVTCTVDDVLVPRTGLGCDSDGLIVSRPTACCTLYAVSHGEEGTEPLDESWVAIKEVRDAFDSVCSFNAGIARIRREHGMRMHRGLRVVLEVFHNADEGIVYFRPFRVLSFDGSEIGEGIGNLYRCLGTGSQGVRKTRRNVLVMDHCSRRRHEQRPKIDAR